VTESFADDSWALFYLGFELSKAGELDLAVDVYTKSIQVYDALDTPKPEGLDNLQWSCLHGLMTIYEQRGDLQNQIECAREILARVRSVHAQKYARERMDALGARSGQSP